MAQKDQSPKPGKPGTSRDDRLKAALKANLARRKAQSRARAKDQGPDTGTPALAGKNKDA
ncbi:hypothetical protein KX928_15655 [Roseobacter sp. YSTF-M11]|uniref:Uncharacterized protein n=1 Tax=Roseobacter insulae TaxID=2859783 RepID=A0A9X1FX78_9RHOB|nr:hypothetical protein [Roseobacter insulae]MBW4709226.1 hypothetical protein [Roseobacter insulae]